MILVTDDLAARKLATQRNVRLTGTVGLLVGMIHASLLPLEEGNALLEKMIDSGYRSPCDHLDDLICAITEVATNEAENSPRG